MFKVRTLNKIAQSGLRELPGDAFAVGDDVGEPDALLVRSADLHSMDFGDELKAIARADVVLLLLDAQDLVTAQDAHVAGYVLEDMRSIVVLVNKWDLIEKDNFPFIHFKANNG